jgi:hypothetical protein
MNKTCAALNYVPVRVAISVWITNLHPFPRRLQNLSFSLDLEKGFIQKSLPWQGHSSVQHMFCSLQTQDLLLRNCPEQYSELAKVGDVDSTTIFWSAKKPLVHADKGVVHLVVVEPDLYLYTLQALLWAYSSSRDTKQISSSSEWIHLMSTIS